MKSLEDFCNERRLEKKWLVGPTMQSASQWIERLVRDGVSCVNLHPSTIRHVAAQQVEFELRKQRLTIMPATLGVMAVTSAWGKLPKDGYFRRKEPTSGLLRALSRTIEELRRHDFCSSRMRESSQSADAGSPYHDLGILLDEWKSFLVSNNLADNADVLRMAADQIRESGLPPDQLVLVGNSVEALGLEAELLRAIDASQIAETSPLPISLCGATSVDLQFYRSIGEANEVREMLRTCTEEKFRLDEIEVLHTEATTYVPLFLDLIPEQQGRVAEELITVADGIPVSESRPARRLLAFFDWIESDFQSQRLIDLFSDGLLHASGYSGSQCVAALRELGIKSGVENYVARLSDQMKSLAARLQSMQQDASGDPSATDHEHARRLAKLHSKMERIRKLESFVGELVKLAKRISGTDSLDSLAAAVDLLSLPSTGITKLDLVCKARICEEIQRQTGWSETVGVPIESTNWLRSMIADTTALKSGPRPGCLHLSSIHGGGQSGRPVSFLMGMCDQNFPGAVLQDPILTDRERITLSLDLPTSVSRLRSRLWQFQNTLTQINGTVFVSWPCYLTEVGSESFPAAIVHRLGRRASGIDQSDWDSERLSEIAGRPVSFVADTDASAISNREAILAQVLNGTLDREYINQAFPHIAKGQIASESRLTEFCEFSGKVGVGCQPHQDGNQADPVYSASSLETLGRCPLAYFFAKRLQVPAPPDDSLDLDSWLEPSDFGQLIHELFRRFLASLSEGEVPKFDRHWKRLKTTLIQLTGEFKERFPPPTASSFRQGLAQVIKTARVFLIEESRYFAETHSKPTYFEAAFGMRGSGSEVSSPTPIDTVNPIGVTFNSGRSIRIRAQVDRIDRIGENRYAICDYKTGSAYGYLPEQPYNGGRRLQSVLYLKVVQQALKDQFGPDVRVTRFDYFFPGAKESGRRISWTAEQLEAGLGNVESLTDLDNQRLYPPTNEKDDCRFCDFRQVCGNVQQLTDAANTWYSGNESLETLKEIRNA